MSDRWDINKNLLSVNYGDFLLFVVLYREEKIKMSNLILHIPHSSRRIPPKYRDEFVFTDEELSSELLKMTDTYTDELFPKNYLRLVFPVSRLVCDPERFRDDTDERMATKGMGAVYTHSSSGRFFRIIKSRENILREFYDSHHENLNNTVKSTLKKHNSCLIIDCHSFSNIPLPYEDDQSEIRPDICIGTDTYHTPEWIKDICIEFFESNGYRVEQNRPYAGTIVPMAYYKKEKRVFSIMIEINRALYMDNQGMQIANFKIVKNDLKELCYILETEMQKH